MKLMVFLVAPLASKICPRIVPDIQSEHSEIPGRRDNDLFNDAPIAITHEMMNTCIHQPRSQYCVYPLYV
jgi:hypothetical protein